MTIKPDTQESKPNESLSEHENTSEFDEEVVIHERSFTNREPIVIRKPKPKQGIRIEEPSSSNPKGDARQGNEEIIKLLTTFQKQGFYPVEDPSDTESLYYLTTESEFENLESETSVTSEKILKLKIADKSEIKTSKIVKGIVLSEKKAELFKDKIGYLGLDIANESFIKDLAKMRTPLQKKLKKDFRWIWTKEDTLYVGKIKSKIKILPSLYHTKEGDKMIIEIDASQEHWGAVLKALDLQD
ncbi:uncharacterized protein LOC111380365 [Olea europaea var. sylvestris]|uniref:uncharacterized protein LOC111380365 n=1 Tax=Olea europaea var. sylvestris TaxID=158386 RepID=UPI000C1D121A|nr:uncharacterized protein LOC111380365 [Olea europaea var. sylvestris]